MLNMTACLAVEVKHLPPWDVDWSDASPQHDTNSLTISDILPTERDGVVLEGKAVEFIMLFLVAEFESLHHLQQLIPPKEGQDVPKLNLIPMKLLCLDEKYKSETTEILTRIAVDAELTGKPQVCVNLTSIYSYVMVTLQITVGDQLTCKIIRGAKR